MSRDNVNKASGMNIMKRLGVLTATTVSLLVLGGALLTGDAVAQQRSLKEQLVGTWIYIASTSSRGDGSKPSAPI
jgi:hypothetical protein